MREYIEERLKELKEEYWKWKLKYRECEGTADEDYYYHKMKITREVIDEFEWALTQDKKSN